MKRVKLVEILRLSKQSNLKGLFICRSGGACRQYFTHWTRLDTHRHTTTLCLSSTDIKHDNAFTNLSQGFLSNSVGTTSLSQTSLHFTFVKLQHVCHYIGIVAVSLEIVASLVDR